MRQYHYLHEVRTILAQFIAAFNEAIVKEFLPDNTLDPSNPNPIKVSYYYASKQKIYDYLKKMSNTNSSGMAEQKKLNLPAVSVHVTSIKRDSSRIGNKMSKFYAIPEKTPNYTPDHQAQQINHPLPIDIDVEMSIMTKTQSHLDQIIHNFAIHSNPYIIISWLLPHTEDWYGNNIGIPNLRNERQEIRSEVLWSGSVSYGTGTEFPAEQSVRFSASTSFTIKGWLFKSNLDPIKKIYTINSWYIPVDESQHPFNMLINLEDENVFSSFHSISGRPQPKKIYPKTIAFKPNTDPPILRIEGDWFVRTTNFYLSAQNSDDFPNLIFTLQDPFSARPSLSAHYPPFSASLLNLETVTVFNEKYLNIVLPTWPVTPNTKFDIIIENEAGYGKIGTVHIV